jgi:choline-sulfatase
MELAGCDPAARATPLDGRSLYAEISGQGVGADEVIGEYLGEGAIAPVMMIRRGRFKFVHSPADPDQLYDLSADPDELENLALSGRHAAQLSELRAEVERRWNMAEIHAAVLESQRRRHLVYRALRAGRFTPWDHQPHKDASKLYVRNDIDLGDLETMARFPRFDAAQSPR